MTAVESKSSICKNATDAWTDCNYKYFAPLPKLEAVLAINHKARQQL
jgi:hypothetical protein